MSEQQPSKLSILAMIIVAVLAAAAVVIWIVTQQRDTVVVSSDNDNNISQVEVHYTIDQGSAETQEKIEVSGTDKQKAPLTGEQRRNMELIPTSGVTAGATLAQIAGQRKTWSPNLRQWYGQDAPDFALKDLEGKEHKLSDYKGRNVMVIFWATWCPPCKMEIPHLKLMEHRISPDKLKILAITNENTEVVSKFVSGMGINYTVLLDRGFMPNLYRAIPANGIPSAAFIDSQGKIKFITSGFVSYEETQAILQANQ